MFRGVVDLAAVANRLGEGELGARASPVGPPELAAVAEALNGLAERLSSLIEAERESLADLSHRLRTPLTSLRLQADHVANAEDRGALAEAVDRMEAAVDGLISTVRQGSSRPQSSDLGEVVRRRIPFWQVLAREQNRQFSTSMIPGPLPVAVSDEDLSTVLDTLVGNVFSHTDPGVALAVEIKSRGDSACLQVSDAGSGFPPDIDLTARGVSGAGSTGLGLDIVRKIATAAGGGMSTRRAAMGGAEVTVEFPLIG
jgi:signal transduction histidine kinase